MKFIALVPIWLGLFCAQVRAQIDIAPFPPAEFKVLAAQKEISFWQGVQSMRMLAQWLAALDPAPLSGQAVRTTQLQYNLIHNKLFLLTHMARLKRELLSRESPAREREMQTQNLSQIRKILLHLQDLPDDNSTLEAMLTLRLQGTSANLLVKPLSSLEDLAGGGFSNSFAKSYSKSGGFGPNSDPYSMRGLGRDSMRLTASDHRLMPAQIVLQFLDLLPKSEPAMTPAEARFLSQFYNLDQPLKKRDLSAEYPAPWYQGHSKACVGFAIAGDLAFELGKAKNAAVQVAPWMTYLALQSQSLGQTPGSCESLRSQASDLASSVVAGDSSLLYRTQPVGDVSEVLAALKIPLICAQAEGESRLAIKKFVEFRGLLTSAFLRAMVDAHEPPIIGLETDNHQAIEGWFELRYPAHIKHVAIVVGYGEDKINPFTLKKEPYFILRDSLLSEPIHYKVSAANLIANARGIWKITGI